jgi:hypothetical protein
MRRKKKHIFKDSERKLNALEELKGEEKKKKN